MISENRRQSDLHSEWNAKETTKKGEGNVGGQDLPNFNLLVF